MMQVIRLDSVDSTNEAAKRLLVDGTIHGRAYVTAREQTAGKGTRGRAWLSPRDAGIYLSVVEVRSNDTVPPVGALSLAAGIACAEVLAGHADVPVQLKPINDLIVEGRKLGGVLTEVVVEPAGVATLITGVGINVSRVDRPVAPDAALPTCLQDILPPEQFARLPINDLVEALANRVCQWNGTVLHGDLPAVERAWARYKVPGTRFPHDASGTR